MVSADVPLWFLRVKGPAAHVALRNTGLDLEQLGITPADVARYGPTIVLIGRGPMEITYSSGRSDPASGLWGSKSA